MDANTYKEKSKELKEKYRKDKRVLDKHYALSNSEVKIGDFIDNGRWRIKVAQILLCYFTDTPECAYKGKRYTKEMREFKTGETAVIYQHEKLV